MGGTDKSAEVLYDWLMSANGNWYVKIWAEGKYLDFWSVNHTLSGGVLASLFFLLKVQFWPSLFISFLFLLAWEIYEILKNIKEGAWNKFFDVVTGVLGFFATHYLIALDVLKTINIFWTISFLFAFLEIWGYKAYMTKRSQ